MNMFILKYTQLRQISILLSIAIHTSTLNMERLRTMESFAQQVLTLTKSIIGKHRGWSVKS